MDKKILVYGLVLFFPLISFVQLNLNFPTDKFYFLAFFVLLILLIQAFSLLKRKEFIFSFHPIDLNILFLILTLSLSVIFASPNKIQALVAEPFGWGIILFLALFYFAASSIEWRRLWFFAKTSAVLVSIFTLVVLLLSFLKINELALITSVYSLEAGLFLGFFAITGLFEIINDLIKKTKTVFIHSFLLGIVMVAFFINLNYLLNDKTFARLPAYSIYFSVAHDVIKKPQTAFLGAGVDINPTQARSFFLQILVETGVLGFSAFILLFGSLIIFILKNKKSLGVVFLSGVGYLAAVFVFFPPSFTLLFLLFLLSAVIVNQKKEKSSVAVKWFNQLLLRIILAVVMFLVSVIGFYLVGRVYLAEYYFVNGLRFYRRQPQRAYASMKKAITLNPYNEETRQRFARLNLEIANLLAAKEEKGKIQPGDQKIITNLIETAIAEAKAAVALNPEKSVNWENLAFVYKNIIGLANGADVWAVAAYERAIAKDPLNPSLRVDLGGVYYILGQYEEAERVLTEAVVLKPDLAKARYNLAWVFFKEKKFEQAVSEMKQVLNLIDIKNPQFEKIKKEIAVFREKIQ